MFLTFFHHSDPDLPIPNARPDPRHGRCELRSSQRLRSDGADAHRDAGTLGGLAAVAPGSESNGLCPSAPPFVPQDVTFFVTNPRS